MVWGRSGEHVGIKGETDLHLIQLENEIKLKKRNEEEKKWKMILFTMSTELPPFGLMYELPPFWSVYQRVFTHHRAVVPQVGVKLSKLHFKFFCLSKVLYKIRGQEN